MHKIDFIFCFYLTGFWFLFFKGIFSFLSVSWSEEKIAHLYFPFLPSHFGAETSIPGFFLRMPCSVASCMSCGVRTQASPFPELRGGVCGWSWRTGVRRGGLRLGPFLPPAAAAAQRGRLLSVLATRPPSTICPSLVGQGDTVALAQTGQGFCGQSSVSTTVSWGSFVFF